MGRCDFYGVSLILNSQPSGIADVPFRALGEANFIKKIPFFSCIKVGNCVVLSHQVDRSGLALFLLVFHGLYRAL